MLVVLLSMLALGSAQAPCDAATNCVNLTRYGRNQRRVLDSQDYNKLLPYEFDSSGGVWQQLNKDGDTEIWRSSSITKCREIIGVCGRNIGPQDNWIVTQPILLPNNLTSIVVEMDSMLEPTSTCSPSASSCVEDLELYVWETSIRSEVSAAETDNYRYVADISSGEGVKVEVSLERESGMMYLGIRDNGTCVVVSRLLVYYRVCEGGSEGLVTVEETVYDSDGNHIVEGKCVENSVSITQSPPLLECQVSGQWRFICSPDNPDCTDTRASSYCACKPGYEEKTTNGRTVCSECPVGTFSEGNGGSCTQCPRNSNSTRPGMTLCPCLIGHYRPSSESLSCIKVETVNGLSPGEVMGVTFGVIIPLVLLIAIAFVLGLLVRNCSKSERNSRPYDSVRHYEPVDAVKGGNGTTALSTTDTSTQRLSSALHPPPLPANRLSRESLGNSSTTDLLAEPEYAVLEEPSRKKTDQVSNGRCECAINDYSEELSKHNTTTTAGPMSTPEYAVLEGPTTLSSKVHNNTSQTESGDSKTEIKITIQDEAGTTKTLT